MRAYYSGRFGMGNGLFYLKILNIVRKIILNTLFKVQLSTYKCFQTYFIKTLVNLY